MAKELSEPARKWILAGNFIAPVCAASNVPKGTQSREECYKLINDTIAEFDRKYPGRRINEPVKIEFVKNQGSSASETVRYTINLKYDPKIDSRDELDASTKGFFDLFEQWRFPSLD